MLYYVGNNVGNKIGNKKSGVTRLNDTQIKILEVIRNNPNITKKQIQGKIGKSKTTVDNGISYLKENGIIEHIGSNKAGYWNVLGGE